MKYQVQYVRIEHQIYTLEVEADSPEEAEDIAEEEFSGSENYNVVHAEEYIQNVTLLQEQTA
jgi:capsular polysaccharide biosynthesis protein